MKNNIYNNLLGKTSVKKFIKIKKSSRVISILTLLLYIALATKCPYNIISSLMYMISTCISNSLSLRKSFEKTKEFVQLEDLYNEFIENYVELNDMFGINNPIQIFELFDLLLHLGLLSNKRIYTYSDNEVLDYYRFLGSNILTGNGVCRHTSAMLSDIFVKKGIDSDQLIGFQITYNKLAATINEELSYQEIMKIFDKISNIEYNEETFLDEILAIFDNKTLESLFNIFKNDKGIITPNHAITYAFKDNMSYYLDPTNSSTFQRYVDDKHILYNNDTIFHFTLSPFKRSLKDKITNAPKRYRKIDNLIMADYPTENIKDTEFYKQEIDTLVERNLDIFYRFYRQNIKLYREATALSQEIIKVKK